MARRRGVQPARAFAELRTSSRECRGEFRGDGRSTRRAMRHVHAGRRRCPGITPLPIRFLRATKRDWVMGKPLNVAPQGNAPANSDRSAEVGVRNQPRVGSATRTAIVDWPPCPTSTPSSMPTSLARSPRPKPSMVELNSSKRCTDVMPAPEMNLCLPPLGSRGRAEGCRRGPWREGAKQSRARCSGFREVVSKSIVVTPTYYDDSSDIR